MEKALARLSKVIYRHAKMTIALIIIIAGLLGITVLKTGTNFDSAGLTMKGTESQQALNIMKKNFSSVTSGGANEKIVFRAKSGKLTDPQKQAAIGKLVQEEQKDKAVKLVVPPMPQNLKKNDTIGYASVSFKKGSDDVSKASINHLKKVTKITKDAGIQTELSGDLSISKSDMGEQSEVYGIIAAIIILAVTFASFIMAGVPIVSALLGLVIGILVIILLSHTVDFGSFDLSLSSMIGLAVGIDYALFIISRYRQEIAKGQSSQAALTKSMTTAGKSVIFAGITVIVALLSMSVLGISLLSIMGFAGAIAVLTAMIMALTVVPACIVLLGKIASGEKANRFLARFSHLKKDYGWGKVVVRFKYWILGIAVVLLVIAAVPVKHINLGLPSDADKSSKTTERRANDILVKGYGKGTNASLVVLAKTKDQQAVQKAATKLSKNKNVASVTPPIPGNGKTGDYTMLTVTPKTDSNAPATKKLVHYIRHLSGKHEMPKLMVTGTTAINIDMSDALMKALPKFALIIGVFAFILLLIIFHSLLIPLVTVLGFVLSILATLGALVFIVQDGHGANLIGLEQPTSVINFLPVLTVGIMFGLAMDYEVFLISRIYEVYEKTGDSQRAFLEGMKDNGKAVFAAILIMGSVFSGFVFAGDTIVKTMGFALALGIFFDALIVRMVLVPSSLAIFGKANWYLPKWLEKILPTVKID